MEPRDEPCLRVNLKLPANHLAVTRASRTPRAIFDLFLNDLILQYGS